MNSLRITLLVTIGLLGVASSGCGPSCQSTCNRLYGSGSDECAISRAGTETSTLLTTCMNACEDALAQEGEVGDYNPDERRGSSTAVQLETDKQAALWMDCINETSCENLMDGYCAPIW